MISRPIKKMGRTSVIFLCNFSLSLYFIRHIFILKFIEHSIRYVRPLGLLNSQMPCKTIWSQVDNETKIICNSSKYVQRMKGVVVWLTSFYETFAPMCRNEFPIQRVMLLTRFFFVFLSQSTKMYVLHETWCAHIECQDVNDKILF